LLEFDASSFHILKPVVEHILVVAVCRMDKLRLLEILEELVTPSYKSFSLFDIDALPTNRRKINVV